MPELLRVTLLRFTNYVDPLQVSACVPVLLLLTRARVLFYCHFPDQLLATERSGALKRFYRAPIDWMEEKTTGMAHRVLVNSRFTGGK